MQSYQERLAMIREMNGSGSKSEAQQPPSQSNYGLSDNFHFEPDMNALQINSKVSRGEEIEMNFTYSGASSLEKSNNLEFL